MSDIVIKTHNLCKKYHLYDDPMSRLKEALHPLRKKYHHDFHALKDINFEVKNGETVGIIGKNGAGKSTLLQILTGVLTPTSGTYSVKGKISSLLELGSGFNPEISGLENVYFNGTILGYSKKEIDAKLDNILAFADIGEFIHQPVKTYSSGMYVRLAFAVAINIDPDVLIIDEALSVGDIRFQQKCFRKLKGFQDAGKTILFVSHDPGSINNYCDRVIWLKDGGIYKEGVPKVICPEYMAYMAYGDDILDEKEPKQTALKAVEKVEGGGTKRKHWENISNHSSFGENGAVIQRIALSKNGEDKKIGAIRGGDKVILSLEVKALDDIIKPLLGFTLSDDHNNKIFGSNTHIIGLQIDALTKGETYIAEFEFTFPFIKNGKYTFDVAIAEGTQTSHLQHHWVYTAAIIHVMNTEKDANIGWHILLKDTTFSVT